MHYTVKPGDSPARIAQRLTGDGARLGELVYANPSKPFTRVGGVVTFASLHPGEQLAIPPSWQRFGMAGPPLGLGDASSDVNAAEGTYQLANTALSTAQIAADVVGAINQFYTSAQQSEQVCVDGNDLSCQNSVQNYESTIQGAQASAASAPDLATAQAQGTIAQAAASSALALAQAVAQSNKGTPGGGGGAGQGGGGGGGGKGGKTFSAAIVAAAKALDAQLQASGCTGCGDPSSQLSTLTQAFKKAIVTSSSCAAQSCPTVTGSTINMTTTACQQAFGPGTLADLKTVLGSAMTYQGTVCTDSNCVCQGTTPPKPQPTTCPSGQVQDSVTGSCVAPCPDGSAPASGQCDVVQPPAPSSSSSSAGPLVAGVVLVGGGIAAAAFALKGRRR